MSIGRGEDDDEAVEGAGDEAGDEVVLLAVCLNICAVFVPDDGRTSAMSPFGRRVGTNCKPVPFVLVVKKIPFGAPFTLFDVW